MKTKYEVRFVYPTIEQTQAVMPGVDVRLIDPKCITRRVVPEEACAHIEVRSAERDAKGDLIWSGWRRMCKSGDEVGKTSRTHLVGRAVCPTCQKNYRAHGGYPEMQLLANWETGGYKTFGV